jgi:dextranase
MDRALGGGRQPAALVARDVPDRRGGALSELLPSKATFAPGDPIAIEARDAAGESVRLLRLDRVVAEAAVGDDGVVRFDAQPEGGYGVESSAGATTALDVLGDPLARPRYGFVSHYEPGRDVDGVAENIRRFHLNAVQFYDWMYRHAQLLPPQDEFEDALGQRISLKTVRRLAEAVRGAGSLPIAYAAVYAVGKEAWPRWQDAGLYRGDGSPWMLGDFLWNVDPTNEQWVEHFAGELHGALRVGFAGFHLDQYGSPKWANRADGSRVDLADAFPALIDRLAGELPDARLIFNNVNDFPTFATARARQALTYIEVWSPHTRLRHLGELVAKARLLAPDRPVILAAYLSAYQGDEEAALAAEKLQLATVFSHGATVLLHGEEHAVLTEAYYVRHQELGNSAQDAARRYFDFAVRYGDLLFASENVDVTRTHLGGDNEEIRVEAPASLAVDAEAGTVWGRAIRTSHGLLVSLIDLSTQEDDTWDAPKRPTRVLDGVRVSVLRRGSAPMRFAAASPDAPALVALVPETSARYDTVTVPSFDTWALILIRDAAE